MTDRRQAAVQRELRTLFRRGPLFGLTDAQLLDRFAARADEEAEPAFSALVERHGSMVFRVCQRALSDPNDALDAFQATFLVLARRAGSIRHRESVAGWLRRVALRVASATRTATAQRVARERRWALTGPRAESEVDHGLRELRQTVREELGRLPEHLRLPIHLCDLDGLTHEQAATQLGCPVGTVKSRLSRGRVRLRSRLTLRGLAPGTALLSLGLTSGAEASAWAAASPSLIRATTAAALEFAAWRSGPGLSLASTFPLAQGVLRTMRMQTTLRAFLTAAALGIAVTGTALLAQGPEARLGAASPSPANDWNGGPPIRLDASVLEMEGTDWRKKFGTSLRVANQEGGTTVWVATKETDLDRLANSAAVLSQAPKVTTADAALATISDVTEVQYVSDLTRVRSGGGGKAFHPHVKTLTLGTQMTLTARVRAEGIALSGSLRDDRLVSFATTTVPFDPPGTTEQALQGTIQVPELVSRVIKGEWVVPQGEALVVSFGLHRQPTRFGFARLRERLVVIRPALSVSAPTTVARELDHASARPGAN